ncbi:MAG: ATP-binding protein [Clostridia bacterium]|nr:ATP-binding protein [Clostridia bacterium]
MKRKMSKELLKWKNDKEKMPLIVYGARQVGKTYTILSFGKENYKNVVYINFEDNSEIAKIFEQDLKIERIIKEISVNLGITILEEDTLIFFDEIQACERALTSLKYFAESAFKYHVIAAGSLLGIAINRKRYSFPVGKVKMITLYPLDFEEFLWAIEKEDLANMIREAFEGNKEFALHNLANEYYRLYLAIGGMPRAIMEYKEKQDMDFVTAILKDINNSYIADMAKYASSTETTKIMAVYNIIPAQLAKENRKFQYKLIKSGARSYEYETAINWLNASGIINQCGKIREGKLPLSAFVEPESFKIYMCDVGLLCNKFGIPTNIIIVENEKLNEFKGALTENYVCSSLVQCGLKPYYWESNGKAEVNFVVQDKEGNIIPIEVKSSIHTRSKSLNLFKSLYTIPYAIRISNKNFGYENGIKCIPLYSVFCLDELCN